MTPGGDPQALQMDDVSAADAGTSGKLPESDGLAVLGRVAFLFAILALVWASFSRPPRIFVSYHTEHFAALYVVAFSAALAVKRRRIIILGCWITAVAAALEAARTLLIGGDGGHSAYLDWIGDAAGVIAALAPMLGQKIRARF